MKKTFEAAIIAVYNFLKGLFDLPNRFLFKPGSGGSEFIRNLKPWIVLFLIGLLVGWIWAGVVMSFYVAMIVCGFGCISINENYVTCITLGGRHLSFRVGNKNDLAKLLPETDWSPNKGKIFLLSDPTFGLLHWPTNYGIYSYFPWAKIKLVKIIRTRPQIKSKISKGAPIQEYLDIPSEKVEEKFLRIDSIHHGIDDDVEFMSVESEQTRASFLRQTKIRAFDLYQIYFPQEGDFSTYVETSLGAAQTNLMKGISYKTFRGMDCSEATISDPDGYSESFKKKIPGRCGFKVIETEILNYELGSGEQELIDAQTKAQAATAIKQATSTVAEGEAEAIEKRIAAYVNKGVKPNVAAIADAFLGAFTKTTQQKGGA